jgi:hypothetical protein
MLAALPHVIGGGFVIALVNMTVFSSSNAEK